MSGERASGRTWSTVWSARVPLPTATTAVGDLMRADGFDTPFTSPGTEAFTEYVLRWGQRLALTEGSSVYEVGCGAGAFLAPLASAGATVGGCDLAPRLVELARRALPDADLTVAEATAMPEEPRYDVVIAHGVFAYFPDEDYARRVVERMAAKAARSVAVMDLPDVRWQEEEMRQRLRLFGNPESYRREYDGLDQRAYEQEWISRVLVELGMREVSFVDEPVPGRPVPSTRFSVVATR